MKTLWINLEDNDTEVWQEKPPEGTDNDYLAVIVIDDLKELLKKGCYCRSGEGTFIGAKEDTEGVCCFCYIANSLSNEKAEKTEKE